MENIAYITSLHPALETDVERTEIGQYVVTVYRMADDGWCGWRVQAQRATKRAAIIRACELAAERLAAEKSYE